MIEGLSSTADHAKSRYRVKNRRRYGEYRRSLKIAIFASLLILFSLFNVFSIPTKSPNYEEVRKRRQVDNETSEISEQNAINKISWFADKNIFNLNESCTYNAENCSFGYVPSSLTEMDVQTLKDICFEGAKEAKQLAGELEREICWYEQETIPGLWIAFYIFCILWLFVAIAIICDDFFVPSLEAISEKLDLSEDVAGATFMAAGSSAPELFTSLAGATRGSDVGVGTIVGSAVFNLLVIVALSAALAGQILNLDWRPITRDSFFYALSIAVFVGFSWDGYIEWWEALILLLLYFFYVALMKFNPQLMDFLLKIEQNCSSCVNANKVDEKEIAKASVRRSSLVGTQFKHTRHGEMAGAVTIQTGTPLMIRRQLLRAPERQEESQRRSTQTNLNMSQRQKSIQDGIDGVERSPVPNSDSGIEDENGVVAEVVTNGQAEQIKAVISRQPTTKTEKSEDDKTTEKDDDDEEQYVYLCPCWSGCPGIPLLPPEPPETNSFLAKIKQVGSWILFILSFPWYVLYVFTIPKCNTDETRKWYIVSFIMSIAWIVGITYAMITVVEHVGCIFQIGHFTMGLVIIAAGTSVPDALSSILVARDGFGDMAVSNAIGSNVFDIDLGLGLPFLIFTLVRDQPVSLLSISDWCIFNSIQRETKIVPHAKFGLVLLGILLIVILLFAKIKFQLDRKAGFVLFILYILFLAYAFTQEIVCVSYLC